MAVFSAHYLLKSAVSLRVHVMSGLCVWLHTRCESVVSVKSRSVVFHIKPVEVRGTGESRQDVFWQLA